MGIIEATPRVDLLGEAVALGVAAACLLLRAWLTSPRRGVTRVIFWPPPEDRDDADAAERRPLTTSPAKILPGPGQVPSAAPTASHARPTIVPH